MSRLKQGNNTFSHSYYVISGIYRTLQMTDMKIILQSETRYRNLVSLFVLLLLAVPGCLQAQFISKINAFLPKAWEGKQAMVVAKPLQGPFIIDTITILNRSAEFTIKLIEPSPAYLWIEGNEDDIQFFIDSPNIHIGIEPGAFRQPVITGSTSSELWPEQLSRLRQDIELEPDNQSALLDALSSGDSLKVFTLEYTLDSLRTLNKNSVAKLILENPQLASSWYLFASNYFPYKQTLELFDRLSSFVSYSSYQKIKTQLARKQLGNKAPNFSLPAANDKSTQLSELTSRFILVDFFERHLITCRKRHFDLRKLYKKYHPLGLEIITVAVEFEKEYGQDALIKYPLPWIQIQDFMNEPIITKDYVVHQMPDNVLLDTNKIMIGRDMSVQELDTKLDQLLKK